MGDAGFFRGTSTEQDSRFTNKQKKLLASMKFPKNFTKKLDMKKVNLEVIKPWVGKRINELMGFEDELVVEYVFGLLEEERFDPRLAQINLTGFLEDNAPIFMKELFSLLLSAQESDSGIPALFIEQKKEELRKAKVEEMRIANRAKELLEKEENEKAKLSTQPSRFDQANDAHSDDKSHKNRATEPSHRNRESSTSPRHHHRSSRHEGRERRDYDRDEHTRHRSSRRDEERYGSRYDDRSHRDKYDEGSRSNRSRYYEESNRYNRHPYEEESRLNRRRHYDDDRSSRHRPTSSRHHESSDLKDEVDEKKVARD